MTPYELQLVPTHELIQELMTRYDHAVFGGIQARSEQNIRSRRQKGDYHTCAGLAMSLATMSLKLRDDAETKVDDSEL